MHLLFPTFNCDLLAVNYIWTCCYSIFCVNSLLSLSISFRLQNNLASTAYSKKNKNIAGICKIIYVNNKYKGP